MEIYNNHNIVIVSENHTNSIILKLKEISDSGKCNFFIARVQVHSFTNLLILSITMTSIIQNKNTYHATCAVKLV